MQNNNKSKLILLDCNAIIHRAYHALPPLATARGEMTNAVYGFFMMFLNVVDRFKPDYIAAAFDLGGETFRHKEFAEYKAHRVKADQELYQQIPIVQDILKSFNVPIITMRGIEADDIIGSVSTRKDTENIIVTGDLDMLQLVDENTCVYIMRKGMSDLVLYCEKEVEERFGFIPKFVPDFKGLKGDPSDNIPGVKGIGDKAAAELIQKIGSVEEIYKKIDSGEFTEIGIKPQIEKKLIAGRESAIASKRLAAIKRDVKFDINFGEAKFGDYNREEVRKKFESLEMRSLAKKFVEMVYKEETKKQRNKETGEIRENKEIGAEENGGQKNLFSVLEENKNLSIKNQIESYYKDGLFSKEIRDLEMEVIPVIEEMEKNGVKIDIEKFKEASKKIAERLEKLTKQIYDFAGMEFNINSSQQLAEILFERLHLSADDLKKTPKGVISTAASELEKLQMASPIIPLLLKYRELEKLRNTYIDTLPALVGPDGRIHTTFSQLGTVTGRISSSDPNLQNIPVKSEEGEEIRKSFIAENGFKLVSFDYSQIDLRMMAHVSGDEKMMEAFKNGEDIHAATAREIFGLSLDGEISSKMRRVAKTINFGIIYGISPHGLSVRLGIRQKEAKEFIDNYFKKFSGVLEYIAKLKEEAKKKGYVETIFGRKRYVKELQSRNWQLRAAGERMAINMPIQGGSADIVKMAMAGVYQKSFASRRIKNQKIKILLQVHDELLFEIRDELLENGDAVKEIKSIMENAADLKVPLVVEAKAGNNWGEMTINNQDTRYNNQTNSNIQ